MKRRLLWIGDGVLQTGFARVAHNVLEHLRHEWDVTMLAINYAGDPHPYPYPIYPAAVRTSTDMFGFSRFGAVVEKVKADVVLINSDPWIAGEYARKVKDSPDADLFPPMVGYVPIDAVGLKREHADLLRRLDSCVFYTRFGFEVARQAGYGGYCSIIPHGIDLAAFHRNPDKLGAMKIANIQGVPPGSFVIGNVNRNQPRKRIDLTLYYFSTWLREAGSKGDNVVLYLHMDANDVGGDLAHLVRAFGLSKKVALAPLSYGHNGRPYVSVPESDLRHVYSALDVQVTTTIGEGWGLTTMEGMACGAPQIVPDYAALGEWARDAAELVPCTGIDSHKTYESGGIGGVADERGFMLALTRLVDDAGRRDELSAKGLELVHRPEFQWANVAERFDQVLNEVIDRPQQLRAAS